jgi:hypothetical protein
MFRNNFVDFFSDKEKSKFELYEYTQAAIEDFVEQNFRLVNGKCYRTIDNKLILAKHVNDSMNAELINEFKPYILK